MMRQLGRPWAFRRVLGMSGFGGIRWLLRDEFTTDLAAGAVNGTAAEPTGTRVVTDGNSKLTISSGLLSFATGGVGAGDPGLWLDAVTRAAGRVMLAEITPANTDALAEAGWDSNQAGAVNDGIRFAASGALSVIANGGTAITVRTYTATSIPVAVAMRATGMCFFAKFSGNWLLLWRSAAGTGNGYPAVVAAGTTAIFTSAWLRLPNSFWLPTPLASDGFGSAFGTTDGLGHAEGIAGGIGAGGAGVTMSNVGATWSVSAGKAINTPTLTDVVVDGAFTNTANWTDAAPWTVAAGVATKTLGTAGSVYQSNDQRNKFIKARFEVVSISAGQFNFTGPKGANYPSSNTVGIASGVQLPATIAGTLGIYGNVATDGVVDNLIVYPLALSELLSLTNAACSDVMIGAALTRSDIYLPAGLALNWNSATSPTNGVVVFHYATSICVYKCVAGVWSEVSATAYTYSAGARLVVWHSGTEFRTYYNNTLIRSDTISDAGILTGTYHGLFSTDVSNTLDDLTIYATGTSGEYSTLNAWSA